MFERTLFNLGYVLIAVLCVALLAAYQIATPNLALTQQATECVVETLNAQEATSKDEFVKATEGIPFGRLMQILQMARQLDSHERDETARQANFMRIKELCRLKFP
jgi:nitrogen fixation/metabolism regulation signal transduction histidine kinase